MEAGRPALLDMAEKDLASLLQRGGFSRQKARWLKQSLEIIRYRMGSLSLDVATGWSDEEVEAFLRSLPDISIKSAKCIMLHSLGGRVLPVDTHVCRVAARLGPVNYGLAEGEIHRQLEQLAPATDRYSFHGNCIWHGRQVCTALRLRCGLCALRAHCDSRAAEHPSEHLGVDA